MIKRYFSEIYDETSLTFLNSGSFGSVYKVKEKVLNTTVALKILINDDYNEQSI